MVSSKATFDLATGQLIDAEGVVFNTPRPSSAKADTYFVSDFSLQDLLKEQEGILSATDASGYTCKLAYRIEKADVFTVYFYNLAEVEQRFRKLNNDFDRLDDISRSTGLGTWEWNVQTGETVFNERWAEIIGYSLEELQPISIDTWMSFAHPNDLEVSGKLLNDYWTGKTQQYVCEARMRHKSGHWVWVVDIGKTITYTKDGQPEWMAGSHQDITERKNNELLLASYKKRLEQTNKVARIGSWEANLETNMVEWSELTREIHEIETEAPVKVEDGIHFYKPGYSRDRIREVFERALTNGEPYDEELQIITAKGNERWVRAIGIPSIKNGKCVAVHGVFQDIDKQKKTLLKLHESTEQFRSTFDNAPNGNALINLQGQIIHANEKLAALTGCKRAELIGSPITDFIESQSRTEVRRALKEFEAGQTEEYKNTVNIVHQHGDLSYCMVGISAVESNEGLPSQCIVQFNDISELKATQSELESQILRLNSSEQVIIIEADHDSKVVFFNIGAQKALGYEPSVALQRLKLPDLIAQETWKSFCDETGLNDRPFNATNVLRELTINAPQYLRECAFINNRNEAVSTLLGTSRYFKSGHNERFFLVATDISKQKLAEKELNDILNITRSQNERLLSFAQIVSHNLRSHTSNLLLLLNLIKDQEPEIYDSQYFKMIDNATQGLDTTIKDLSQIAAINNDPTQPDDIICLLDALHKLHEQFRGSIVNIEGNIKILVDNSIHVLGSQAFVDSVFTNLFSNSIKYRSDSRPLSITIDAVEKANKVQVQFRDNGTGFDSKAVSSKVFKLYQTFHKSKDSRGIGLFITKNQMEQMGGSIDVESKPDDGATFTLIFRRGN